MGPLSVRWYGLLFALTFFAGYHILRWVFRKEGKSDASLDRLLIYGMVGTVVGARLGHCFFYEPVFFLDHPLEIVKFWKGGLASHGGAVGILASLYLYTRGRPDQPYLWLLDRVVIPTALGGLFIRMGNLFNSEIIGTPTDVPWAFVFTRVDALSRHPAQLYEALAYGLIFCLLLCIYRRRQRHVAPGALLGLFLTSVFTFRFLVEFVKERQAAYELELLLSVGQWLSIPMILAGIILLVTASSRQSRAKAP